MAIAFVQDVANGGNAASQTTAVITVTVTTTVGNHLVLSVVTSAGDLSSVTDTKGNTWQVDMATGGTHTARVRFASAKITSALVNTDTITITTSVAGRTAGSATEVSGLDPTTWFDKSASAEVTAATAGDSGLTATTTLADELLYGATAVVSTVTAFTPEVVSPVWNLLTQGASTVTVRTIIPAYRIISATGTYAFKSTWTTARDAANGIVTYKAAAAASVDGGPSYRPVILANKHTGPRALRYRFRQPYLRSVDAPAPVAFDPSTGFPWPSAQETGETQAQADETAQAWAIRTSPVFVGNEDDFLVNPDVSADDTAQAWTIQVPAAQAPTPTGPWTQVQDEAGAPVQADDTAQSYAIQPVVQAVTPTGPWTTAQEDAGTPPSADDTAQAWSIRVGTVFVGNEDEPTAGADSVDDTAQAWTIQVPPAVTFNPASGFPWTNTPDEGPSSAFTDDTEQPWAVQPVTVVTPYNPANGFPWPTYSDEPVSAASSDDTVQPWAIGPETVFTGNVPEPESDWPVWYDLTAQAWTIVPPTPAITTVFAGNVPEDGPRSDLWADDTSQAWNVQLVVPPIVSGGVGGPPPTAIAVKPTPFGKAYTERP